MASSGWKDQFLERIAAHVRKGNYRHALGLAKTEMKKHPNEFVCKYQYARLLGDWADELPAARKRKLKRDAVRMLRPLTRSLAGKSEYERYAVCLNYYYQSEAYRNMYRFGRRFAKANRKYGVYSQALGATLFAEERMKAKDPVRMRSWARKAVKAWNAYPLNAEKYYFAHYNYAKALAFVGDRKAALAALKTAARLSRRGISDWEFADVVAYLEFTDL